MLLRLMPVLVLLLGTPLGLPCAAGKPPTNAPGKIPTGVTFHWDTLQRKGITGDNWCMTWAADDHLYTTMDDGIGFQPGPAWNNRVLRIKGDPSFTADDVEAVPGWPFTPMSQTFYMYGALSVDKRIYHWVWLSEADRYYGRPIANRLVYTDDFGETYHRWDGTPLTPENAVDRDPKSFFFYKEDPTPRAGRDAYAFNWLAFCQHGKDNELARDDYVYMYSVEQKDVTRLSLIRVPKDQVCDRSAYQFLKQVRDDDHQAVWTTDPAERGPTIVFPEKNDNGDDWLWCSWYPDVVYNAPLDRYIMVSYGISDGPKPFFSGWNNRGKHSATVGMWHAPHPWGPWTRFYYQTEWKTPGDPPAELGFDGQASRTYQFHLSPKWISDDGRTLVLVWSDAGGRWDEPHFGHDPYWYRWNQVQIELTVD